MTNQKYETKSPNDVERGKVTMNHVIDAVKIGIPTVAGFTLAVIRGVPKIIKLIKR